MESLGSRGQGSEGGADKNRWCAERLCGRPQHLVRTQKPEARPFFFFFIPAGDQLTNSPDALGSFAYSCACFSAIFMPGLIRKSRSLHQDWQWAAHVQMFRIETLHQQLSCFVSMSGYPERLNIWLKRYRAFLIFVQLR